MATGKRKASKAQLAARKRFAQMAKAGAFKRSKTGAKKRVASSKASKTRKAPSAKQLAARKKFIAMVRARAAAKKKTNKRRAKNPGRIRFSEADLAKYAGKIKGLSLAPVARATTSGRKKKKGGRFKKAGLFGGSGLLGLGRSRKRIRVNKRRASRNPSPARVFSEFRGKQVASRSKGFAAKGTPAQLATLGKLKELRLRGKRLNFGGRATLAASSRKRLYVANVRMKRPNPPGEVDYGEIVGVVYYADKPHIETGSFNYDHKFESPRPHLIVDEEGCPKIEGGGYKITEDGIEG